jgi:hypothetical protein
MIRLLVDSILDQQSANAISSMQHGIHVLIELLRRGTWSVEKF